MGIFTLEWSQISFSHSKAASIACKGGDICHPPENTLREGEGDCDKDNDCQQELKYGKDNCAKKGNGNPNPYSITPIDELVLLNSKHAFISY